jgi:hypothetical protein
LANFILIAKGDSLSMLKDWFAVAEAFFILDPRLSTAKVEADGWALAACDSPRRSVLLRCLDRFYFHAVSFRIDHGNTAYSFP